jgi:hypothetical protein
MWSGDPVTSYTYQWQNCDATGSSCWNVAGATGASYQVPAWELNETVQVTVTASNSGGSSSGTSAVTGVIGGPVTAAPTYFPSSFFAQPLAANASLDPQSPQMVQQLTDMAFGVSPSVSYNCRTSTYVAPSQWNSDQEAYCHQVNGRAFIDTYNYAPTIYTVPAGQPTVSVTIPYDPNLQAALQAVPIPPGAVSAPGTDGQMIIWQPSSDTMWELWRASVDSTGQWHAGAGGRIEHVSTDPGFYRNVANKSTAADGVCSTNSQVTYCERSNWGTASSKIPNLPGLMTIPQLQSGQINHALLLALPDEAPNVWSWPAQNTDGGGNSIIPQGAMIRIDPNLNLDAWFASLKYPNGLPRPVAPIERIIAQAMQTYGAVVNNSTTGGPSFYSENWSVSGNNVFQGPGGLFGGMGPAQFMTDLPWEDMQVLQTNMCNAIQPGSTLVQTSCKPPQYITANPNPPSTGCPLKPLSVSPQPGQTTGPSVTITAPSWPNVGQTHVPFAAFVTDPSGVTHVDFKIDGQLRYVGTYPDCGLNNQMVYAFGGNGGFWDVWSEPTRGWHTLEVDAYDSLGLETTATKMEYNGR